MVLWISPERRFGYPGRSDRAVTAVLVSRAEAALILRAQVREPKELSEGPDRGLREKRGGTDDLLPSQRTKKSMILYSQLSTVEKWVPRTTPEGPSLLSRRKR